MAGDGADVGKGCAGIATAVVDMAGDGKNITDRHPLAGIGVASPNLCGIWNWIVSSSWDRSTAASRFPMLDMEDSMRSRMLPVVFMSSLSLT